MAKVFRLYDIQGNNTIVDWQNSILYGSTAIEQIKDPDGATAGKEITSIPSPFARIDLIKTAFREVVERANKNPNDKDYLPLDAGNVNCDPKYKHGSIYHKMVSETLDVAQIFFDFEKHSKNFEIIVWDREKDLDKYSIFGKTLKRYLESDATKDANGKEPYNFSKFKRMYLLNYIGKDRPSQMNIIGATSPATLFFSSANNLSYVTNNVSFGQDKPFDSSYNALFYRDFEFVKYLYSFRVAYPGFNIDFPELDNYLGNSNFQSNCYKKLSEPKKDQIDVLSASSISEYETIAVGKNDTFEILGRPFHKKPNITNWKSDFEIKSDLYKDGKKPLVLPVEKGNTYENHRYTTDRWGKDNKAEYYNPTPWVNRTLPNEGTTYPYLTISDFLQNNIVHMPYKLNDESFYSGGYNGAEDSFLLPLKDTFFRFFTVKDLQGEVDGKKMFEFVTLSGGIKVILRIPIQKGFIEYSRAYFESSSLANDNDIANDNDGKLFDKKFGLGLLPLITFPENVKKHYRIAVFDKGQRDTKLTCYNGTTPIAEEAHIVRDSKDIEMNECSKEAYVITENFDRINVLVGETQGVIVPKFQLKNGNKIYTFAIDFGTTNSHIEYGFVTSAGTTPSNPNSFNIPLGEKQLHRLHTLYADRDINGAFEHNFIPDTIADKDDFTFPMRTVFAEWNQNNRSEKMHALANGNIPFLYEKDIFPEAYNEARTELKWRGEEENSLVELYLENIFLLLRNKVALNGGNLEATKIIWFYPASMDTGKFDNFNGYWKKYYKKYFCDNDTVVDENLITISESAAPFRYYKRKKGAKSEVVTIDIGGGTTDVYIVENDKPAMLLSFLFASSAIFGDGGIGGETRWDSDSNGFVQRYYNEFVNILDSCGLSDLVATLGQIEKRHNSPDIVAFLFSLIGNKKVNDNGALDFLTKLSNNKNLKYVFIVFYGAILYFIAKSMKAKGLKRPLTLAFSGNGAKTLRVLSSNNNTIGQFAKLIFDGVYNENGTRLDIIFEDEPKKATSKGGILNSKAETPADIKPIKFTLIGDDMNSTPTGDVKFDQITEDIQEQIVNSGVEFIDFLFQLHENNDEFLTSSLSANDSIIEQVKEICSDRVELSQSLKAALSHKRGNKKVEETLFFYPLIGVLHELAQKVIET